MTLSRRDFLGTAFGFGSDIAFNGARNTNSLLERMADSTGVRNAEAVVFRNTPDAKASSGRPLEKTVENELDAGTKISWHYNEAVNALEAGSKNPGLYRVAIDNANEGLKLIEKHNVGKNFESGFHLCIARGSSKTGKAEQMFDHYLQVLVKGRQGGIMNGALKDIFEMNYARGYRKVARKQMEVLSDSEKNKIRAELLNYGVGIYLGARLGFEVTEAKRVKKINEIFGFMEHPRAQYAVNYMVGLHLEKERQFENANPNILLPYKQRPSRFKSLESGNPAVVAVHNAMKHYPPTQ